MGELYIQATHTQAGVNLGDHGQDMHRAIPVTEDTTLGELVHATVAKKITWPDGERIEVEPHDYITIRVAASTHTPSGGPE